MATTSALEAVNAGEIQRKIRVSLLKCKTKRDLLLKASQIAREQLNVQSVSIYLFNKIGLLERVVINSLDSKGNIIEEDLWESEAYEADATFMGKVVASEEGELYGTPQIINFPTESHLSPSSHEKISRYSKMLGSVNCLAAFPLDGQNRTYGVLEVVNKLSTSQPLITAKDSFQEEDVDILTSLANHIATGISNVKRIERAQLLERINQKLVKAPDIEGFSNTLDSVLEELVSDETSFEACVLRVVYQDRLKVRARAKAERIDFRLRDDGDRIVGEGFAGKTFKSGKSIGFLIGEPEIAGFKNEAWIRSNDLKSFRCFPLKLDHKTVGTLSVFVGYEYIFHDDAIEFLEQVTPVIAAFIHNSMMTELINSLNRQLEGKGENESVAAYENYYNLSHERHTLDAKNHIDLEAEVLACLDDRRFDFRTAKGISRSTGIEITEVQKILENSTLVRRVLVTDKYGNRLFTHRRRKLSLREVLAVTQRILAMPFSARP